MSVNGVVSSGDLFFFYGLLQPASEKFPEVINLAGNGEFLHPARIRGDLYDVGGYPGIVPGEGLVSGVLYRVDNPIVVPALDAFEDIIPDDPEASLYFRAKQAVLDRDGNPTRQMAWVYNYNKPVDGYSRIEDGDWVLSGKLIPRQRAKRTPLQWAIKGVFAAVIALFAFILLSVIFGVLSPIKWLATLGATTFSLLIGAIVLFGRGSSSEAGPDFDVMSVRED